MLQVVSANRLVDGRVVYLDAQGNWVEKIEAAATFAGEAECAQGLEKARAAVAANLVIDPFAVAVIETENGRQAVSLRDAIRAKGPTIHYGRAARRT
ncbi:MAG TPA: DUF2849 domain-containing protein [Methylovirgula sp.]|nr:DUF2849 domain-containing protein [Methylovirgula sp.]